MLSATAALCVGLLGAADDKKAPEPPKPSTEEQIKAWLKTIEEPSDKGAGSDFEFRIRAETISLARAGEAARPGVFALFEDTKKPSQARAQAAVVLVEWLKGKGARQELDPKSLAALKSALEGKDLVVKWAVLHWSQRYGKAYTLDWVTRLKETKLGVPLESLYFSDEAMDGLLPSVIALVANDEPKIAAAAAHTIFNFGRPKQGVKELLAVLDRREAKVRAPAVSALGRVGRDDPKVLEAVLGQLKPEHYAGGYYAAVIATVEQFGPKAKGAVPALIAVLKDDNAKKTQLPSPAYDSAFMYSVALDALGAIGPEAKDAVPAILARMRDRVVIRESLDKVVAALDKIDPEAAKEARAFKKQLEDDFRKMVEQALPKP